MDESILDRVFDPDFSEWLASELRNQGFPIGDVAAYLERVKQRHAEQVRANNKRRSEKRRAGLRTKCV